MRFLFLLFVIVPIVEIVLLINVGQAIGAWYTIGLVLLSAFIGVNMLRHQGLSTLLRARSRMADGEIPAQEMIEGLLLAVGGALLVTPGFVTDLFGFCCLIPALRQGFVKRLQHHFTLVAAQQGGAQRAQSFQQSAADGSDPAADRFGKPAETPRAGQVLDGEFRRDD